MNFTPSQIAFITLSVTVLLGLTAAIITAFVTLRTNSLTRKNEHKLAILKVLLEVAYKEYEFRTKDDIETAKLDGNTTKIRSFTEYVIFYKEMAEIFSKKTITDNDIITTLANNKKLIDTYYINREKYKPDYYTQSKSQ